jgi:FKBP-type peptidyl-prolyl cis-trans isomerase
MSKEKIVLIVGAVAFVFVAVLAFRPNLFSSQGSSLGSNVIEPKETIDMSDGELIIEDLSLGEGEAVKAGDAISIHYHGTLTDGTVFDSSVERGVPFETTIGVGQLISGWDQGIPGMKVGGKRRLTIPPNLAYGNRATGGIPAGSTLIFEVELLDIVAP